VKFRKPQRRSKFVPSSHERHRGARWLLTLALLGTPAWAQSEIGQADITLQGYSLTESGRLSQIYGPTIQFGEFLPGVGLLSGRVEGYDSDGSLKTGESYLTLRGLSLGGYHWDISGGDFRTSSSLVDFPFQNIFYPEIAARGVRIQVSRSGRSYTIFAGAETLPYGPRVPFRQRVPQSIFGASLRQKVGSHWQVGLRLLRLTSSAGDIESNPFFFPVNRQIARSTTLTAQSLYSFTPRLKFYTEATLAGSSRVSTPAGSREASFSALSGFTFDGSLFIVRANYAYQSTSYLPLLGYFAGDRRGPFGEIRYRLRPWAELFASVSSYTNNLEHNPLVPTFHSQMNADGATLRLPWRLSITGQITYLRFRSAQPGTQEGVISNNRQIVSTVARPFRRQSLRFTFRDLNLRTDGQLDRQRSAELEDVVQFRHFVAGAAARFQRTSGDGRTNTIFGRGFLSASLRGFTAYANVEKGADLVNRTVFATNSYNTAVVGMTARLGRGWDFQIEAFRTTLLTEPNPENVFLLAVQGAPVSSLLSGFNQRSVYFRLTKHLHWGGAAPAGGLDQYAEMQTRLVGNVEGVVHSLGTDGPRPAAGVAINFADSGETVTDSAGRFRFLNVPEGTHRLTLASAELPADYDPGLHVEAEVIVQPRHTASVALDVWRLGSIYGAVSAADASCRGNMLIRLDPSGRYTTTDAGGSFAFYNLREGEYEALLDEAALPVNCALSGGGRRTVAVRGGAEPLPVAFELNMIQRQKPVRKTEIGEGVQDCDK
jgi:hypothetical protein